MHKGRRSECIKSPEWQGFPKLADLKARFSFFQFGYSSPVKSCGLPETLTGWAREKPILFLLKHERPFLWKAICQACIYLTFFFFTSVLIHSHQNDWHSGRGGEFPPQAANPNGGRSPRWGPQATHLTLHVCCPRPRLAGARKLA